MEDKAISTVDRTLCHGTKINAVVLRVVLWVVPSGMNVPRCCISWSLVVIVPTDSSQVNSFPVMID